jgi:polysaccharide chain length determinant protein (PEP-CTERM system associated)
VLISVGTFFGSLWLPRSYRSEATIMVEPQTVPSNYVQSTISVDVTDRLQNIREEILSRTRLYKVITEFDLYGASRHGMSTDDMVEMVRKNITVEVVNDPKNSERSRNVAAFKIAYTGRTPLLVQQVTRKLASLFIEENLRKREQEAEGTTDFLDGELEKMRQSLQEQEVRIQAFKSAHAGELPEQQVPTLQMLGQLQSVLQANSDAITRAMQQKNFLELVLENMRNASTPQNMKSVLQLQYDAKNAELISAQQRYKPGHPDIARLQSELKAMKAQLAAEDKGWTGDGRRPSTPAELQAELDGLSSEITQRNARQAQLEKQMQQLQVHLSALPRVEQQLAELMRDYDTTRTSYQTMLSKRNYSSVAAEMERRAKGEQFRILDPASYPEKPFKPNLLQIDFLGVLAGVFVGGALALLMEVTDDSLYSDKDVTFSLALPTLAAIPWVPDAREQRRDTWRKRLLALAVCLSAGLVLAAGYFLRSSIVSGFGWRF